MLPSVLTLLDFAASGVAVADTGAQGVMPFPFGLLDGASEIETAVTPEVVGGDDVPWGFQTGSKRRGSKRKRRTDAERIAELQRVYARIVGEAGPAAAVVAAVQPYVEVASDARSPPVEAIDWRGLLRDLDAVAVLLQLHSRILDEEEDAMVLLLFS